MRAWILLMLLLPLAGTAQTSAEQEKADIENYTPVPYRLTKVVKVTVRVPSVSSDTGLSEDCSTFVITRKRATYFFNHAKIISNRARTHDKDMSYCHAEGTVMFANGDRADWTISRYGTAVMALTSGKLKDRPISLFCAKCEDWRM